MKKKSTLQHSRSLNNIVLLNVTAGGLDAVGVFNLQPNTKL